MENGRLDGGAREGRRKRLGRRPKLLPFSPKLLIVVHVAQGEQHFLEIHCFVFFIYYKTQSRIYLSNQISFVAQNVTMS